MKEKIDNLLIKLFLDTKRKYIKKIKQIFDNLSIDNKENKNNGE